MTDSPKGRRALLAWCLYDFGNSAFTTLVVTFVYATYFTRAIARDTLYGTAQWTRAVALSGVLVALLSPALGSVADRGGYRKPLLLLCTITCIAATAFLYLPVPGDVGLALTIFVIGNVAFELGHVFYNAFLPEIAPRDRIGRVSGYGWALGYVGGLLALAVALLALIWPERPLLGFDKESGQHVRATNLLVAGWYAIFAAPLFIWVGEQKVERRAPIHAIIRSSMAQLASTFREIRRYRQIVRFLVARLFYNDGLVTIFALGGIYAVGTFGFGEEEIMVFGIVLNVAAGVGALGLGFLDDSLGGRRTVLISVAALLAASTLALLAESKAVFWGAAVVVGLFSGPNQASSRSLMGRFVPPDKENEFFGFFAFSGKFTSFLGPLAFGWLTELFGSQRAGMAAVVGLLLLGGILLLGVDEQEGIRLSGREDGRRAD